MLIRADSNDTNCEQAVALLLEQHARCLQLRLDGRSRVVAGQLQVGAGLQESR